MYSVAHRHQISINYNVSKNPLSRIVTCHQDCLSAHSPPVGFQFGKELNLRLLCLFIKSCPLT